MEATLGLSLGKPSQFWEHGLCSNLPVFIMLLNANQHFFLTGLEIMNIMFSILCCICNNPLHHLSASIGLKFIKEGCK